MGRFFSARVFTLFCGLGYAVAVYVNYPVFRYYPLTGQFSLSDLQDPTLGPAMSWYGWMAVGAIAGLVTAAVVPKRLGDRIPDALFWILPVVIFAAGWVREREWFVAM